MKGMTVALWKQCAKFPSNLVPQLSIWHPRYPSATGTHRQGTQRSVDPEVLPLPLVWLSKTQCQQNASGKRSHGIYCTTAFSREERSCSAPPQATALERAFSYWALISPPALQLMLLFPCWFWSFPQGTGVSWSPTGTERLPHQSPKRKKSTTTQELTGGRILAHDRQWSTLWWTSGDFKTWGSDDQVHAWKPTLDIVTPSTQQTTSESHF